VEDRHLRKVEAAGSNPAQSIVKITNESFEDNLSFLELKALKKGHLKRLKDTSETTKSIYFQPLTNKKKHRIFQDKDRRMIKKIGFF
jgi:hypothetical protein